jgi:aminoglycoside phosphotransferase (APT) family kinase protein
VLALPQARLQLLSATPSDSTVLHGDVHSRNVILRAGAEQPVLIDWGRARLGSELEDVSSWLHSLGTWVPEIRRSHDTLLRRYLAARGLPTALLRTVRDAYWLALASNSLAGALGYQLAVALDTVGRSPRERVDAVAALRQHLRVIRRADAVWRA